MLPGRFKKYFSPVLYQKAVCFVCFLNKKLNDQAHLQYLQILIFVVSLHTS
jgi:hypothetical protein